MFILSKLAWLVLNPGNLFLLVFCLAVVLSWTYWRAGGRTTLSILAVLGVVVAVLPFGAWLIVPLENRFPPVSTLPARVDGIVVLGGALDPHVSFARGQPAIGGDVERLLAGARLARAYPKARLVFTAGSGLLLRQERKDAEVARQVFVDLGLDDEIRRGRVLFENQSRNTYENAVMTRDLVRPRDGEVWLVVTSARHMPRAMGVFRRAGWFVTAYPVDYATDGHYALQPGFNFAGGLGGLGGGIKEWVGLLYYYVIGRTETFFPAP